MNEITTYSEMNKRLINLLNLSDDPIKKYSAKRIKNLEDGILRVAIECNCRAEHGAEGAEHLLMIEKMLMNVLNNKANQ